METTIDRQTAEKEVTEWLDARKVGKSKREKQSDVIESMIEAMEEGRLVIEENRSITYTLIEPIKGDKDITELNFKFRITTEDIQIQMTGVNTKDVISVVLAYFSALTGVPKSVLRKLDSSDYSFGQGFASFFM